ncbi:Uncharacterised protein [Klebsiella aerogenes]|nr:Uncharacterised protein [Klebsiella aerogenes]
MTNSSRRRLSCASRCISRDCSSIISAVIHTSSPYLRSDSGSPVNPITPTISPSRRSGRLIPWRTPWRWRATASSISTTRPCDSTSSAPSCNSPIRSRSPLPIMRPRASITLILVSMMRIVRATISCAILVSRCQPAIIPSPEQGISIKEWQRGRTVHMHKARQRSMELWRESQNQRKE